MDTGIASSGEESHLISLLSENCEAAEQVALETVTAMDMPVLNSLRELTKGECLHILENHQNTFSIVEQALVLSGLTDYITCASQNELFHTFQKKADRRGLSTVFMCLSRKWVRFFHKLGPYDLTSAQLKSVLFLLRQSVQRLPETYQKSFFSCALAMGESSLKKAEAPPQYSTATFIDVKATQCTRTMPETKAQKEVTSMYKPDIEIQNYSITPKNNDTVVSQKTVGAANGTSEGKKNHCVKPKDLSPAASRVTAFRPRYTPSSVQQIRPATAASVRESTKGPLQSAVKKTKMNYKSDITKYMVKTQKDKLNDTEMAVYSESLHNPLNEGKENRKIWPVSSPAGSNMDNILKEWVTHATPTGKSCMVTDVDSPNDNMQAEGSKVAYGTVNAFELMMERSRACERQNVKPKSLFQRVSKVV